MAILLLRSWQNTWEGLYSSRSTIRPLQLTLECADHQKGLVTETYAELKRYELTHDKIEAAEKAEENRVAQLSLDEIAIQKHQRMKS